VWELERWRWRRQVFGKGEEENKMDDEQGRSLVSFPYPAGAAKGADESTVIKERDAWLGWFGEHTALSVSLCVVGAT
jgi:hypothetical protein